MCINIGLEISLNSPPLLQTNTWMYNQIATAVNDVLKAHDKDRHLIADSDGSVIHKHKMSLGWALLTAGRVHLAT